MQDYIQFMKTGTMTTLTIPFPVYISENPGREEVDNLFAVGADMFKDYPEFDNFRFISGQVIDFSDWDSIIDAYSETTPSNIKEYYED